MNGAHWNAMALVVTGATARVECGDLIHTK